MQQQCSAGALGKKGTQDETQFTTKIGGKKLVWVLVVSRCKIFITGVMPYYAETGYSRPLIT